jgi:hypothetical protein
MGTAAGYLQKAGIGLVRRAIDTTGEMHNNTLPKAG